MEVRSRFFTATVSTIPRYVSISYGESGRVFWDGLLVNLRSIRVLESEGIRNESFACSPNAFNPG